MYISNNSNIGMATLLQQNKATCMKTLTNGGGNNANSNNSTGGGTNGIIVGGAGTTSAQVTGAPMATIVSTAGGGATTATVGGNFVLSAGQTIVLTNGATGASSILNFQQYQQLLQQQQQQQQVNAAVAASVAQSGVTTSATTATRVLMPHEMVTLPIGSLVTTSGGGLALITNANTTSGNSTTGQGQFLVATSSSQTAHAVQSSTIAGGINNITSFQHQFQQQISGQQQGSTNANTAQNNRSAIITQQPTVSAANTRYFSQFSSQQQPAASGVNTTATATIVAAKGSGNRTTHVLINRSKNTIIAGNTTQRLQHAKFLNKPPVAVTAAPIMIANAAVAATKSQINHTINSPAIQAIKLPQQQKPQQHQQQRYTISAVQPIKPQQKPIVVHASNVGTSTVTKTIVASGVTAVTRSNVGLLNGGATPVVKNNVVRKSTSTFVAVEKPALALAPTAATTAATAAKASSISATGTSTTRTAATAAITAAVTGTASTGPPTSTTATTKQVAAIAATTTSAASASIGSEKHQHVIAHSRAVPTSTVATVTSEAFADTGVIVKTEPVDTTTSGDTGNSTNAGTDTNTNSSAVNATEQENEPEIDIVINNVVCSFSVRCHLNLREIALKGLNVEYRRENGMVTMKLRRPYTTASIWSSGRITCTGSTSEEQAKIAARRYARCLQKLGFRARFQNFRVVNVLGTCSMPWAIKIVNFSEKHKKDASYEPELHPGVTYKLRYPKATLKIFSTGSITVTAASVANVQAAIEHIFPLVYEFRKKRSPEELEQLRIKQQNAAHAEIAATNELNDDNPNHSPKNTQNICRRRSGSPLNISKHKRRKLANGSDGVFAIKEEQDADDPEPLDDENIVMYSEFDDLDDLIEGPDDED